MKLVTYASTPGLEKYPPEERFQVYRAVHKRLLAGDASYRGRLRRFKIAAVMVPVLLAVVNLLQPFLIPSAHRQGIGFLVVPLISSIVFTVWVLRASLRLQAYQNRRIGQVLQEDGTGGDKAA